MGDAEIAFTPADSRAAAVTCTWRTTDNVFLALMTDLRVWWYGRYPIYWAVRLFGWRYYTDPDAAIAVKGGPMHPLGVPAPEPPPQ